MFHAAVCHSWILSAQSQDLFQSYSLTLSLAASHFVSHSLRGTRRFESVTQVTASLIFLALKGIWPFTFSPHFRLPFYQWNRHAANSRHIVLECLRGIQECSWEFSVLQQQLELHWAAWGHFLCLKWVWTCPHQRLWEESVYICCMCSYVCVCVCVCVWSFKCVTGRVHKIGFNTFNPSWSFYGNMTHCLPILRLSLNIYLTNYISSNVFL